MLLSHRCKFIILPEKGSSIEDRLQDALEATQDFKMVHLSEHLNMIYLEFIMLLLTTTFIILFLDYLLSIVIYVLGDGSLPSSRKEIFGKILYGQFVMEIIYFSFKIKSM